MHRKPTKSQDKIDYVRVYRMKTDSYKTLSYTSTTVADDLLKAMCEKVTKISRAEIINQKKKKKKRPTSLIPKSMPCTNRSTWAAQAWAHRWTASSNQTSSLALLKGFGKSRGLGQAPSPRTRPHLFPSSAGYRSV